MSEHYRKCAKCGVSKALDPSAFLHKFPRLTNATSALRVRVWAQFCFPQEDWTSMESLRKLSQKHTMLCSKHFDHTAFQNGSRTKLNKFAEPFTAKNDEGRHMTVMSASQLVKNGASSVPISTRASETTMLTTHSEMIIISASQSEDNGASSVPISTRASETTTQTTHSEMIVISASQSENNGASSSIPISTRASETTTQTTHSETMKCKKVKKLGGILKPLNIKQVSQLTTREQDLYKKCRNYMSEILRLRAKFQTVKTSKNRSILRELCNNVNISNLIESKMTDKVKLLVQSQIVNLPRKLRGRRWLLADKMLALSIYKKSPSCYRLLRRLFCLPSQSSLKNILNRVPMTTGVDKQVCATLKTSTAKCSPEDNLAVLLFDEMSIRKNVNYCLKTDTINGYQDHGEQGRSSQIASYALVFMVVGLRKRFKQPIAHYFSGQSVTADRLSVLMKEVLKECFEVGLEIVATVCDLDGVNIRALNNLGSTKERPFFEFEGHEIVTFLDPPHLLKCFRNNFLKHNILCPDNFCSELGLPKGSVAKWQHIEHFHKLDGSNANFVFAPALTSRHLNPNGKEKMKVKLAAQVLSHSVAAGIHAKVATNELPSAAAATAAVLEKMDQLFDCVNADSPSPRRGKIFSKNWTPNGACHKLIQGMKYFFNNMQFVGASAIPPSQNGWIRSINAFERLFLNVQKKKIKTLATRRLNQDPLENCFGCIRSHCGSNANPTVQQFIGGLKAAIISNLMHISKNRNCEDDQNDVLANMSNYLSTNQNEHHDVFIFNAEISHDPHVSIPVDDVTDGSGEQQACAYVSGFILRKQSSQCENCRLLFTSQNPGAEISHIFINFKEYNQTKSSLNYPSNVFINTVEKCATIMRNFLDSSAHTANIKNQIQNLITHNVSFEWLDKCSAHKNENQSLIVNSVFAICVKRFCLLKNRMFQEQASKISLKRKLNTLKHA